MKTTTRNKKEQRFEKVVTYDSKPEILGGILFLIVFLISLTVQIIDLNELDKITLIISGGLEGIALLCSIICFSFSGRKVYWRKIQ